MAKTPQAPLDPSDAVRHQNAVRAVTELLDMAGLQGMIIGGVAAGIHGRPRFTADVDAVTIAAHTELDRLVSLASTNQLEPRRPDVIPFAKVNGVLQLRHMPSGIGVDISLGSHPFEQRAVARAIRISIGDWSFRVATPEDLVIMKAFAGRPIDYEDIRNIRARRHPIRWARVRRIVGEFQRILDRSDLVPGLDQALKPSPPLSQTRWKRKPKN